MGGCASVFLLLLVMSGLTTIGLPWWLALIAFLVVLGAIAWLEELVKQHTTQRAIRNERNAR